MTESQASTFQSGSSRRLDLVATGVALTVALVGLFVLCEIAALAWPSAGLAHGWVRLFAGETDGVVRTFVAGILGSVVGAWVASVLFVPVYNQVAGRWPVWNGASG